MRGSSTNSYSISHYRHTILHDFILTCLCMSISSNKHRHLYLLGHLSGTVVSTFLLIHTLLCTHVFDGSYQHMQEAAIWYDAINIIRPSRGFHCLPIAFKDTRQHAFSTDPSYHQQAIVYVAFGCIKGYRLPKAFIIK